MMTSQGKSSWKRVLIVILLAFFIFCLVSMVATKFIYDAIFGLRPEEAIPVPEQLQTMVRQRLSVQYESGDALLTGYLYRAEGDGDTLVLLAPGFHARADSYLWQIRDLTERGWSVFAFDATGNGASQGDSYVGFSQIVYDLRATLNYIEKQNRFGYNEIVLLGHSQGGYGVCGVLAEEYDIGAVVTVSGVNSAMEGVVGLATSYIGPLAWGNYGFLWLYQGMLFDPRTVSLQAHDQLEQSRVPALVIHGSSDSQVPADRFSIYAHRDEVRRPEVEFLLWDEDGYDGHTDLLFDPDGTANRELMERIHQFLLAHTA